MQAYIFFLSRRKEKAIRKSRDDHSLALSRKGLAEVQTVHLPAWRLRSLLLHRWMGSLPWN
jgi:hypothetical protein